MDTTKKMNWKDLLSTKRKIEPKKSLFTDPRHDFEKDIDQIIYSYPFRRLQDKTQVIPLPIYDFVHTRLTHTLEVASIGRSLGKLVVNLIKENEGFIDKKNSELTDDEKNLLISIDNIPNLLIASCYAHDIGNPPFGHAGEAAISHYFIKNKSNNLKKEEKKDFSLFEGNANGFRILIENKSINPTYAMLAVFTKYPRQSYIEDIDNENNKDLKKKYICQKKYGFFNSEKETFKNVAEETGLLKFESNELKLKKNEVSFKRHPLTFLLEAADDIANYMIDFEDALKLNLIDFEKVYYFNKHEGNEIKITPKQILEEIAKIDVDYDFTDYDKDKTNTELISFLRSKVINVLIHKSFEIFKQKYDEIMTGEYDSELVSSITDEKIKGNIELMKKLRSNYFFSYRPVLECEASGFEILYKLIKIFSSAFENCQKCGNENDKLSKKDNKVLSLLPNDIRNKIAEETSEYKRTLLILDYISGMTDNYAIDLHSKITGIKFPR